MMMNYINHSNVNLKTIASDVNLSQENRNVKSKHLCNDEKNIANIIDLLIKISMLKKEKSKDHSWKKIALKLIQHFQLDSEEKHHVNQNTFIAKNVQKLKTSIQLLNKQLQIQRSMHLSMKITSWVNMIREETMIKEQCLKNDLSSLCKKREVMIKIMNRREIKEIQKKLIEQILQKIASVLTD